MVIVIDFILESEYCSNTAIRLVLVVSSSFDNDNLKLTTFGRTIKHNSCTFFGMFYCDHNTWVDFSTG